MATSLGSYVSLQGITETGQFIPSSTNTFPRNNTEAPPKKVNNYNGRAMTSNSALLERRPQFTEFGNEVRDESLAMAPPAADLSHPNMPHFYMCAYGKRPMHVIVLEFCYRVNTRDGSVLSTCIIIHDTPDQNVVEAILANQGLLMTNGPHPSVPLDDRNFPIYDMVSGGRNHTVMDSRMQAFGNLLQPRNATDIDSLAKTSAGKVSILAYDYKRHMYHTKWFTEAASPADAETVRKAYTEPAGKWRLGPRERCESAVANELAAAKADNAKLRAELQAVRAGSQGLHQPTSEMATELAQLRAHNEAMRKGFEEEVASRTEQVRAAYASEWQNNVERIRQEEQGKANDFVQGALAKPAQSQPIHYPQPVFQQQQQQPVPQPSPAQNRGFFGNVFGTIFGNNGTADESDVEPRPQQGDGAVEDISSDTDNDDDDVYINAPIPSAVPPPTLTRGALNKHNAHPATAAAPSYDPRPATAVSMTSRATTASRAPLTDSDVPYLNSMEAEIKAYIADAKIPMAAPTASNQCCFQTKGGKRCSGKCHKASNIHGCNLHLGQLLGGFNTYAADQL